MRLQRIISGLSRKRSGIVVLMGLSAVLAGAERLLAPQPRGTRAQPAEGRTGTPADTPTKPIESRRSCFRISQTRSDIGLVYWVLQGFGCYESFSLHDSWREAMDEANRRIATREQVVSHEEILASSAFALAAH